MPAKRRVQQTWCFVPGCADKIVARGLCTQHTKLEQYRHWERIYELEKDLNPPVVSAHKFRKHLLTITKDLPVSRTKKTRFLNGMQERYANYLEDNK